MVSLDLTLILLQFNALFPLGSCQVLIPTVVYADVSRLEDFTFCQTAFAKVMETVPINYLLINCQKPKAKVLESFCAFMNRSEQFLERNLTHGPV